MGIECQYSFHDLFKAAHGRRPTEDEYKRLMQASQHERNKLVVVMARLAGWQTAERMGSDGVIYVAFWPSSSIS